MGFAGLSGLVSQLWFSHDAVVRAPARRVTSSITGSSRWCSSERETAVATGKPRDGGGVPVSRHQASPVAYAEPILPFWCQSVARCLRHERRVY